MAELVSTDKLYKNSLSQTLSYTTHYYIIL